MVSSQPERSMQSLYIQRAVEIAAPTDIAFEAMLEQLGPASEMPDGSPFPMKLEAWPGGRWFRDLGNNTGHFWAHVQVIKPPTLLELCGPLFMSYPAISHVAYRFTAEGKGTRLQITHRAMGEIMREHMEGVQEGWDSELKLIRQRAEKRAGR